MKTSRYVIVTMGGETRLLDWDIATEWDEGQEGIDLLQDLCPEHREIVLDNPRLPLKATLVEFKRKKRVSETEKLVVRRQPFKCIMNCTCSKCKQPILKGDKALWEKTPGTDSSGAGSSSLILCLSCASTVPEKQCRYWDCPEGHKVGGEEDPVTCSTCRKDLGLPELE